MMGYYAHAASTSVIPERSADLRPAMRSNTTGMGFSITPRFPLPAATRGTKLSRWSVRTVARTRAARMAAGDPKPSLEGRYGTRDKYVEAVKVAAERSVDQRFLTADDAARVIREAQEGSVLK
jgi:hypothetical protein